jgi:hypothetical protein
MIAGITDLTVLCFFHLLPNYDGGNYEENSKGELTYYQNFPWSD